MEINKSSFLSTVSPKSLSSDIKNTNIVYDSLIKCSRTVLIVYLIVNYIKERSLSQKLLMLIYRPYDSSFIKLWWQ